MNDALLIQQATGPHAHLLNLTVKEHADYCLRHGFDYWPVYGDALTGPDAGRHAFWNKVALLRRGLDAGYKHVVWLDSDCYIADPDKDLREACLPGKIGLVWHGKPEWPEGPECYDHYNAGAIYVGNGPDAARLLKCWWNSPDDGHVWHDQNALNAHAIPDFAALWKRPAPIKCLGYEWNAVPFEPFDHERPIVRAWHGYQRDLDLRLEAMQAFMRQNTMRLMVEGCTAEEAAQKADYCASVGNYDGAIQFYERAAELGVCGTDFVTQYARALYKAKRYGDAAALYRGVVAAEPDSGLYWQALSSCYDFLGEHKLNGDAIREGLRCSPGWAPIMHNQMLWNLREGNWREGFDGMKWQFITRERIARVPGPEWDGKPLDECGYPALFVCAEQGLGDTLMLARYLPDIDVPRIVWEVQPPLVELMRAQCWPGIEIVPQEPEKGVRWDFDAHIGMFTLPSLMGTVVDSTDGAPYLIAPPDKVAQWAPRVNGPGLRVGFSWAGSAAHGNNANRNCTAGLFDDLVQTPGTRWYSLQRGLEIPEEIKAENPEVTWIGEEPADMADTAGILANLDLVITIDSAIAHLCGALGVPCWVMLSKSSDWRWLLGREDTVWYDSVRLFRQETLGDWQSVMVRVEQALKEKLADGR